MKSLSFQRAPPALHISARAAVMTAAYLAAAAAVLLTVFVLRALAPASLLARFLGYVLIASLAAGLEPGTVKAAALSEVGVGGADAPAYIVAAAVKGLIASPVLALVWRFADPGVTPAILAMTPLIAVAGFCATDLRVLFDLAGRYGRAICLKQGSLAGGVVVTGAAVAMGAPLGWAIGVSSLARLALVVVAAGGRGRPRAPGRVVREAFELLVDGRWLDLAAVSVIGAIGGSTDRVFGLRYLSPGIYSAYYLAFELLSRFWLIPYILGPVLFARRAAGDARDTFIQVAWALTAIAGALFLAGTAAMVFFTPAVLRTIIGVDFGLPLVAFAAAVVSNSFTQLRVAELQGAGRARRAVVVTAVAALVSVPLFYVAARWFGAPGLLVAWLGKAGAELAALAGDGPGRARGRPQRNGG